RCDNHIDLKPDELGRNVGETLAAALRPAIFDRHGPPLVPAKLTQPLHERGSPIPPDRIGARARRQKADGRQLSCLLRPRREGPCRRRCAAEQRDELAPPDHSITSSARASRVGGTTRLSNFAVCRLITNSNFVALTTGKSVGFAP